MQTYQYSARDINGRQVKGILQGEAEHEILEWILGKQYTPVSIEPLKLKEKKKRRASHRRVRAEDMASLCWQLNTMMEGGVPITEALDTIAEDITNYQLQNALLEVSRDMKTGESFHDSLAAHPKLFDSLFCSMIKAGESGGTFSMVMQRLSDYYDKRDELHRKVKKALAYPIFVVAFVAVIVVIMMVFVVPRFEEIFASLGSKLPPFTLAFMAFYQFVKKIHRVCNCRCSLTRRAAGGLQPHRARTPDL